MELFLTVAQSLLGFNDDGGEEESRVGYPISLLGFSQHAVRCYFGVNHTGAHFYSSSMQVLLGGKYPKRTHWQKALSCPLNPPDQIVLAFCFQSTSEQEASQNRIPIKQLSHG